MIQYIKDNDQIVQLLIDMPGKSVNLLCEEFFSHLERNIDRFLQDREALGLILCSGKKDFIAGADLEFIKGLSDPKKTLAVTRLAHHILRKLETCGKPVVAALNGTCLGGGLEVVLACHYRICLDKPKIKIGFPEVTLGLLPGAGGTQRLTRLLPLQKSLELLVEGRQIGPQQAKELGLIHELAKDASELLAKSKAFIQKNPQYRQPWDQENYKLPGGGVQSPQGYRIFSASTSIVQQKTWGNYPAPLAILNCVYQGLQLPFEKSLEIEAKYFAQLVQSPEAKNMIRSLFFGIQECHKGPAEIHLEGKKEKIRDVRKVGVLGAGMMGQGIAYVSARAGIEVVLKDTSLDYAKKGKAYSEKILDLEVSKGRLSLLQKDEILSRILVTDDPCAVKDCDLVIEAVIEDRKIKKQVTEESEKVLSEHAIFASNTSTLPITGLAQGSQRPANFIGLHFFSPVEKMPLVEIISGEKTSSKARAFAFNYVRQIQKTPIFVNDGRGFYTSRVFMTYVGEGMSLLNEGINPALIENAGRMTGMPVGPLAVADEVGLNLVYHIIQQTEKDIGKGFIPESIVKVTDLFVKKLERWGKKTGKGFYEYPNNDKKFLWPGLKDYFPLCTSQLDVEVIKKRLLYIQSLETVRCLEENILLNPHDADVGSIYGWGFPPYTGGTLSFIDWIGLDRFIQECEGFKKQFGPRFAVPKLLHEMKKKGTNFYGNST